MKPLTREEFQDALQTGLGRAVVHVREHGSEGLRDDILNACLHNLSYDPQVEGDRTAWMLSIIDLTRDEEFYRSRIMEAVPEAKDVWDTDQLMRFVGAFVQRGYEPARQALYRKFDLHEFNETWLGGEEIVTVDGIAGLLHIAEVLGSRMLTDPDYVEDDLFLSWAEEQLGEVAVRAALVERAKTNDNVRVYLTEMEDRRSDRAATRDSAVRKTPWTFEGILKDIESAAGDFPGRFMFFGERGATPEQLDELFARLLFETRRDQLIRYLWVFRHRAVPRLDKRLFELAREEDKEIQDAAIAVLSNMQHPSVRELAIHLIRKSRESICRGAISLFSRNYVPGDAELIQSALWVPNDQGIVHGIGFDLCELGKMQPYPELAGCLLWVYEHSPCSNCRENAVKFLIGHHRVTEEILRECLWDSYEETRKLAKSAFEQKGD